MEKINSDNFENLADFTSMVFNMAETLNELINKVKELDDSLLNLKKETE